MDDKSIGKYKDENLLDIANRIEDLPAMLKKMAAQFREHSIASDDPDREAIKQALEKTARDYESAAEFVALFTSGIVQDIKGWLPKAMLEQPVVVQKELPLEQAA